MQIGPYAAHNVFAFLAREVNGLLNVSRKFNILALQG